MIELNKVLLVGRLTRDPETRYTTGGQAVANFSVACNRRYKDRSGERRDDATYIDCEAWGKTAEFVQQWFSKGKAIFVEGRLKQDSWEDRTTGQKRSKLLVSVDRASFVDTGSDREGGSSDDGDGGGGGGGYRSGGRESSGGGRDSGPRRQDDSGSSGGGGRRDSDDMPAGRDHESVDDDLPF